MRHSLLFSVLISICLVLLLSACSKDDWSSKKGGEDVFGIEEAILTFPTTDYQTNIEVELEKADDYDFYTKGIIKYEQNGKELAKINFGDGEKDIWAEKIVDGESSNVDLTHKGKESDFQKKVILPLIKAEDCDYIVEGSIEYWKNGKWIATVDFGDGTCDDLATKTWDSGSKTINLSDLVK